MSGTITVNNSEAYQVACLAGLLGLIQAPAPGVRALIEAGKLVEVLPQYSAEPMPVTLFTPTGGNLPKRVRVFMDWIAETLASCIST